MMKRLTLQETAASLDLPVHTLERWIRQGRIPIVRTAQFCEFREEALSRWARQHHIPFRIAGDTAHGVPHGQNEALQAVLRRGVLLRELRAGTPADLLGQMVRALPGLNPDLEPLLLERLLEREALGSTGVGRGIALPHPRTPLENFPEKSCIVTAFPEKPIPYGAIDGQPVFVLFMLLAPDVKAHLSLLSRLSFCLRDRDFHALLSSRPEDEILFAAVEEMEKAFQARGSA